MYCKYFAYDGTQFDSKEACKKYEESNIPYNLIRINSEINSLTSKADYNYLNINCKSSFNKVERCKKNFVKELYRKQKTWKQRASEMYKVSNALLEAINDYNDMLEKLHNKRSDFNYLKSLEEDK